MNKEEKLIQGPLMELVAIVGLLRDHVECTLELST